MSNAGHIHGQLQCLFVLEDPESSVKGLLALVQTFPTAPISLTTSMMIGNERHQPLMKPLHDGSYSCNPLLGIGTTFIVPISANQGAVRPLPLMQQPDSSWWYLSNTIDFDAFNLYFM